MNMNIGPSIKNIRKHRQLTQAALAAMAGITQVALSGIEKGKRPGEETLNNICNALQVSTGFVYAVSLQKEEINPSKKQTYDTLFPIIKSLLLRLTTPENMTSFAASL